MVAIEQGGAHQTAAQNEIRRGFASVEPDQGVGSGTEGKDAGRGFERRMEFAIAMPVEPVDGHRARQQHHQHRAVGRHAAAGLDGAGIHHVTYRRDLMKT